MASTRLRATQRDQRPRPNAHALVQGQGEDGDTPATRLVLHRCQRYDARPGGLGVGQPWSRGDDGYTKEHAHRDRQADVPGVADGCRVAHGQFFALRYPACWASASLPKVTRDIGCIPAEPGQPGR